MEQYRFHVPAGIAERVAEQEEFEKELLDHEVDGMVQYLGTLFVFNLPHYLQYTSNAPLEMRDEVKQIARTVQIVGGRRPPETIVDFSRCFAESDQSSYAWQEHLKDEDLLKLLQLFRVAAQMIT